MSERIPLEHGGYLTFSEHGAQVTFTVSKERDESGLYKAWLRGPGGEYLLGTLSPEQDQLTVTKTVSKSALLNAGCWPVSGGYTALAFPFSVPPSEPLPAWRWEHRPGHILSDPILQESAANWGSMLIRHTDKGFQLAAPLNPHYPFPITPLFCLAVVENIDGQPHATFSFDPQGNPLFLSNDSQTVFP